MKYTSLIFAVFIYFNSLGQILGTYSGKEYKGYSIDYTTKEKVDLYEFKFLTLTRDSSFFFEHLFRTSNQTCEGCLDTLFTSGIWKINADTIALNSKYFDKDYIDFYEYSDSSEKFKFVISDSKFCDFPDIIVINDGDPIKIKCNDTLIINESMISKLVFYSYVNSHKYNSFEYVPKTQKSNVFVIDKKMQRGEKNNFYVVDKKFLLTEGKLTPIINNDKFKVEDFYKK